MFFLASYGEQNFGPWFKPEIHVKVPQLTKSRYAFILADEATVRIQSSPKPELVGEKGLWGSFREKLQCSNQDLQEKSWLKKEARVSVDIIDPLWRCVTKSGESENPAPLMVDLEIAVRGQYPAK